MKFFKTLVNNSSEFINNEKLKSLDGLKTVRTNYCQLLWLKSIIEDMGSQVDEAIDKYTTNIEPIIKNVSKLTKVDEDYSNLYDMWDLRYHSSINPPEETKHSWADMSEYEDICKHIKALSCDGYPDNNNIRPIKELKSETADRAESKFSFTANKSTPSTYEYYIFETNGVRINLPIVEHLDEIPSCFYYYEGDRKHPSGVYISPFPGVIMQVPAVSVVPYSMENANFCSMKCKEKSNCKNIRCTYAHPGTDYIKVGCVSRCPRAHGFGDKDSLAEDLKLVTIEDIRIVSMYGLNDLFSASLWFSSKITAPGQRVLNDLEVCDNYTDEQFLKSDELDSDKFH